MSSGSPASSTTQVKATSPADADAAATAKPATSSNNANSNGKPKKRVLIIGAGCSGMSAAYSLSLSPDEFAVKVYDKQQSVGGSATSYALPKEDKQGNPYPFGAEFINDGVQGASPVFHNTFRMFEDTLGYKATEVGMQISFGKGKESFWSNVFPSELVDHFSDDIKKVSWHLSPCASRPYSLSFDLSSVASSRQSSVSK